MALPTNRRADLLPPPCSPLGFSPLPSTYSLSHNPSRSSVGLFVATILISLVVVLSSLGLIWETLRKVRKRSSGKGWKQLQDERRSNQPLGRFYEPRQGQLYDPAPAPGMGQRQGGPVMMRQGHGQIQGQRGMPPPIPPMPRQYQQQHPAALQAGPNQRSTSAMPQEIVYQSSPVPTRENSQVS